MQWYLDCFVQPYAYRLPEIVKKLSESLELDETQVDMYIAHCFKLQSALSKKRRLELGEEEPHSTRTSKRRFQIEAAIKKSELDLSKKTVSFEESALNPVQIKNNR